MKLFLITAFKLSLILVLLSNNSYSQSFNDYTKKASNIVRSALSEMKGYELLRELCAIGPRLSGSENSLKAIYWAKEKMEMMGLDKVWLQPVMVPHWERGNTEEAFISGSKFHTNKKLNIAAFGGSISTGDKLLTAEVLEVRNFKELDSLKDKAKGKIIFFSRPLDQGLVNTFAGYGGAVDQRSTGAIWASYYGAVGCIVRSVTTKHDNTPHVGNMNYVDTLPKIPSVAVGYQDADFLSEALKREPYLKLNIKLNCRTLPDARSYNVIGEIKGTEKGDEIIVVGGHFDSWDKGDGAHDNGAGCIQSLEVLDLLKRLDIKPKRTIRCVFFINEENGVRGAIAYAGYSDTAKEKHIAAIESDRGAFTPLGFSVDADSSIIVQMQKWLPILNTAQIEYIRKGGSGVDISFIKNIKAKIGYVPDNQRYMDVHHSANDTFDTVHPREFELGSAAITILTYLLSEEL